MPRRSGCHYPISYFRRLVIDLMHFSAKVPSVTIDRRMNLAPLIVARNACSPKPTWSAIFMKAYALVAARVPELRTSYMKFPWPNFYQHPGNIATMNVERQVGDERTILYVHIRRPENRSLQEIDDIIRRHKEAPLHSIKSYQNAVRMSRIPWPFRQWIWWASLNVFGRRRCHNFGTFGITSVAGQGAGIHRIIPLLTSTLHYGLFDEAGTLEMRLSFDHRVLDGVTAALALCDMDKVLLTDILEELKSGQLRAAA